MQNVTWIIKFPFGKDMLPLYDLLFWENNNTIRLTI